MSDLISRADAIEAVERKIKWFNGDSIEDRCKRDAFIQVIDDVLSALPSADAEQIVYCMDCAKSVPLDEHGALWKCKAHDRTTLRHSYCNKGELKGGDDE